MENNSQEYINALIGLEPVFKKAGELALKMRKTAKSKNKFNTGVAGIDIVTEADTAVQEFILLEMAKTKLVECELIAEEDTPSVKKFKGANGLVLALDPIDGTIIYASTGRFFSTIVSLYNKEQFLYTFCNYPVVNFSKRITGGKVEDSREFPKIKIKDGLDLKKIIVYTHGNLQKQDSGIYDKLIKDGYKFLTYADITDDAGSCSLFFSGQVAGFYKETPNPYDGFTALHYGQAKKFKIYGDVDLSNFKIGDHGPHYSGWYLVLQK
jgi:fructose-1,6-bisphosphatase/inositol monophosphatase family enzyme